MNKTKIIFMAKETESSKLALQYLIDTKIEVVRADIRKTDYELQTICCINNIIMCKEENLLSDYRKVTRRLYNFVLLEKNRMRYFANS